MFRAEHLPTLLSVKLTLRCLPQLLLHLCFETGFSLDLALTISTRLAGSPGSASPSLELKTSVTGLDYHIDAWDPVMMDCITSTLSLESSLQPKYILMVKLLIDDFWQLVLR